MCPGTQWVQGSSAMEEFPATANNGNDDSVTWNIDVDRNMTRFNITMNEALNLIERAVKFGKGGEVFIPKLNAYKVGDLKNALIEILDAKNSVQHIPVRQGEKYHESLLNLDELRNTYEMEDDFLLIEQTVFDKNNLDSSVYPKTKLTDQYSSDKVNLLSKDELKQILLKENLV